MFSSMHDYYFTFTFVQEHTKNLKHIIESAINYLIEMSMRLCYCTEMKKYLKCAVHQTLFELYFIHVI